MLPERPPGTEGMSEEQLAELVTRDAMIGVAHGAATAAGGAMNGAHDLGGMHGFGPVEPEPDEPVFHPEWERRAFALTLATGFLGKWNIDMSRFAREQMPPAEYLATTYYEHWLWGLEKLLVDARAGPHAGGDRRRAGDGPGAPPARAGRPALRVLAAGDVEQGAARDAARPQADEDVRAALQGRRPRRHARTSTRSATRDCPATRAASAAWSTATTACSCSPTPRGNGLGTKPQHCYSVRFDGARAVGRGRRRRATPSTSTCGTTTWMPA